MMRKEEREKETCRVLEREGGGEGEEMRQIDCAKENGERKKESTRERRELLTVIRQKKEEEVRERG